MDALAKAVAHAETNGCTKGYGAMYSNCHGIKRGNTVPCEKIGQNRMCIFSSKEESNEAFKKIWTKWYGGLPNMEKARRWSGNDHPASWLNNVLTVYNKEIQI